MRGELGPLYADLHVHSTYSRDSLLSPDRIVKLSLRRGLGAVAVTDHDTVRGGLETRRAARGTPLIVVPGVEVRTPLGDVTLLMAEEEPGTRDPLELRDVARESEAILLLPHPLRGHRAVRALARLVDVIEALNGRTPRRLNLLAMGLAASLGKPVSAGSDAHCCLELGCVRLALSAPVDDEEDLRRALLRGEGRLVGRESVPLVHVVSGLTQVVRGLWG